MLVVLFQLRVLESRSFDLSNMALASQALAIMLQIVVVFIISIVIFGAQGIAADRFIRRCRPSFYFLESRN